ncbi:MAG TPA: DNA replication and repair protein RecF [Dehalococcoidia bacterium]|nr:DNA replication and repair protein RecF [Dehalococcoidia bacterium]
MHLAHLTLTNFRTFRSLDMDFQPGLHLVTATNASGKTNLLEAIAMIATTKSPRSAADVDLVSWAAVEDDPLPVARLAAHVETSGEAAGDATDLAVAVVTRPAKGGEGMAASRRFQVNGVARRASDLIGRLRVVMFSASDLAIISGAPTIRRRFMDLTISQFEPAYVRASQRYARVLQQRNSLLRRLQERRGDAAELDFWDDEAATAGAVIISSRAQALASLGRDAAERYAELSPGGDELEVRYRPELPPDLAESPSAPGIEGRFRDALREARTIDIRAGVTRIGPHRDDVGFLLGGHDAGAFASRGEQRSLALALRLGEVALSTGQTGDPPLLLLDDILSELDAERRERVLAVAYGVDQVFVTSPDADRPSEDELPNARRYGIADGELVPR